MFSVLALEFQPLERREAWVAGGMAAMVAILCPATVIGVGRGLGLDAELILAVGLIAAAPIAVSAGVQGRCLGLPTRPPVWAALAGSMTAALVLPAVVVLCGGPDQGGFWVIARRALLFGIGPAAAALLLRRIAPRPIVRCRTRWTGLAAAALLPVAFVTGGTLSAGLSAAPGPAAVAIGTGVAALAVCGCVGAGVGRLVFGRAGGLAFALVGTVRNGSFALAALSGAFSPRVSLAIAVLALGGIVVPAALTLVSRWGERRQRCRQNRNARRTTRRTGVRLLFVPGRDRSAARVRGRATADIRSG